MLFWSFASDQTQKQYKLLTEGSDGAARTCEGCLLVCLLRVFWLFCGWWVFFLAFLLLRFRFCTCSNSAPNLGGEGTLTCVGEELPQAPFSGFWCLALQTLGYLGQAPNQRVFNTTGFP